LTDHEDHKNSETKEKSHFTLPMLNVVHPRARKLNVPDLKSFYEAPGETRAKKQIKNWL